MHTTAAHSVLSRPELYHLICESCDNKTLSALSLTSRDLQETALNQLWSDIPDLAVLICCMPSDCWQERIVGSDISLVISFEFYQVIIFADEVLVFLQGSNGYRLG
jgi:hypothetical protein